MTFAYTTSFPNPPTTLPLSWKPPREVRRFSLDACQQSLRQFDLEIPQPTEMPRQNIQLFYLRPTLYLSSDQHARPACFLLYIDLIISFLRLVPTLGITQLYYSLFRYNPANEPENRAERGCASPSPTIFPRSNDELLDRIAFTWKASLDLSSVGVLASVMGFFQLLSVRNDVIFTSLVLGACVLTWSSIICGLLYMGCKKSLATLIAEQRELANSPHFRFWRLLALPVIFLAWGVLLCFIATIYISFTGFNNAQPIATPPTAVGGIFVLGISAISAFSIYDAARSLGIPRFK